MNFFVSWYPGDLWIPDYDPTCRVLISVSSVSKLWSLDHFNNLPLTIILDSGGFRYATLPYERLTPNEILTKQIRMVGDKNLEVLLCTLDYPIFDQTLSSNEKDRCITQTIAYAYEMMRQFEELELKSRIQPMAIIQGYDVNSLRFCAHELRTIGFSRFGLGSLLAVRQNEPEILKRVDTVIDQVGTNLHIFGVSNLSTIRKLRKLGVASFDSTRPAKSAMYNQLLFYIGHHLYSMESRGESNLHIPILPKLIDYPCDCPVCKGRLNRAITIIGKRQNIALRTIHNYWHLKKAYLD